MEKHFFFDWVFFFLERFPTALQSWNIWGDDPGAMCFYSGA